MYDTEIIPVGEPKALPGTAGQSNKRDFRTLQPRSEAERLPGT